MSSGMNTEQAKEYAKTMTYREAVSNVRFSKGIKYRKATMIKLRELATIADRLDRKTEPTISKMEQVDKDINVRSKDEQQKDCETCKHYNPNHEAIACERCLDGKYSRYEPQTERSSE